MVEEAIDTNVALVVVVVAKVVVGAVDVNDVVAVGGNLVGILGTTGDTGTEELVVELDVAEKGNVSVVVIVFVTGDSEVELGGREASFDAEVIADGLNG